MEKLAHISHIWKRPVDLAHDLGLPFTTVYSWTARGRIPADRDLDIIAAAKARGVNLTLERLAQARAGIVPGDAA